MRGKAFVIIGFKYTIYKLIISSYLSSPMLSVSVPCCRHTLLRLQKEIRAQSAAQRRQAYEMIQKDKHTQKLFPSRCDSACKIEHNTCIVNCCYG